MYLQLSKYTVQHKHNLKSLKQSIVFRMTIDRLILNCSQTCCNIYSTNVHCCVSYIIYKLIKYIEFNFQQNHFKTISAINVLNRIYITQVGNIIIQSNYTRYSFNHTGPKINECQIIQHLTSQVTTNYHCWYDLNFANNF